jgi:hypothetical protein
MTHKFEVRRKSDWFRRINLRFDANPIVFDAQI